MKSHFQRLFFHFKLDASNYSLFDSTMSTPIIYGSFNLVSAVIKNLSPRSTIFYFELDNQSGWQMKKAYKPDNTIADTQEKSDAIDETK